MAGDSINDFTRDINWLINAHDYNEVHTALSRLQALVTMGMQCDLKHYPSHMYYDFLDLLDELLDDAKTLFENAQLHRGKDKS